MSIQACFIDAGQDHLQPVWLDIGHRVFSGGEIDVRVPTRIPRGPYVHLCIFAHVWSAEDLVTLMLVTDALKRVRPEVSIDLILPYIPYARQDRICNPGEAFGLKIIAEMINRQGYRKVFVADSHSVASGAAIDRIVNISAAALVPHINRQITAVVAPDAGAEKRALEVAVARSLPLIQCVKNRDRKGTVISVDVSTRITEEHGLEWLVVDDICDGGGTFVALYDTLNTAYKNRGRLAITDTSVPVLSLFTTHAIYRSGTDQLRDLYRGGLYCANVSENASDFTKNVVVGSLNPNTWLSVIYDIPPVD